jgi:hypothetical protein
MSAQFNDFSSYTHQFAAAATRAHRMALETAETVFGVQLKTFEKNMDATTAFFSELTEVRDIEGYKNMWPKGVQIVRDNAERVVAATQEVIGLTLKNGESLGQIAKVQMEAASENVQDTVAKATKAARGK